MCRRLHAPRILSKRGSFSSVFLASAQKSPPPPRPADPRQVPSPTSTPFPDPSTSPSSTEICDYLMSFVCLLNSRLPPPTPTSPSMNTHSATRCSATPPAPREEEAGPASDPGRVLPLPRAPSSSTAVKGQGSRTTLPQRLNPALCTSPSSAGSQATVPRSRACPGIRRSARVRTVPRAGQMPR